MNNFEKPLNTAIKKYITEDDRKNHPDVAEVIETLLRDNVIHLQRAGAKRWKLLNDIENIIPDIKRRLCVNLNQQQTEGDSDG